MTKTEKIFCENLLMKYLWGTYSTDEVYMQDHHKLIIRSIDKGKVYNSTLDIMYKLNLLCNVNMDDIDDNIEIQEIYPKFDFQKTFYMCVLDIKDYLKKTAQWGF